MKNLYSLTYISKTEADDIELFGIKVLRTNSSYPRLMILKELNLLEAIRIKRSIKRKGYAIHNDLYVATIEKFKL